MVDREVRVEASIGEGVVLTDGADGEAPTSTDNGSMAFPMTSVEVEAGIGNGAPDVLLVANKTSEESPSSNNTSNKIDLSASGYTLKKLKELEAIRAERARRQHDSVSEIIARLDERGIGKVSLQGVQVEAFAHPMLEQAKQVAQDHDYAAYAAALKEADDDALAAQEQEVVGELKNTNNLGADICSSKSMENHLQRAFESASGLHRDSGRTLPSSVEAGDDNADGYEVVHGEEDDRHFYASALRHVEGGDDVTRVKPKGAGVYKEHITSDAVIDMGKNNSDTAAGKRRTSGEATTVNGDGYEVVHGGEVDDRHIYASALKHVEVGDDVTRGKAKGAGVYKERNKSDPAAAGKRRISVQKKDKSKEHPKQKEDLIAQFDASGVGVNVDGLHAQAYSMNASKYDASFKSRKGTLMGDGSVAELAPQKDLDEVVGNLANRKNNAQDPMSGEVVVPDRDAGADDYERQLKARLNEAKEKAGPAPNNNGPVLVVENKPLSPDQHEQQMKKPRPPEIENQDVQHDGDGEETDDSDYVGEVNALHMEEDVVHEEEPEEKEMAGGEEGMDNSSKALHIGDDATKDEQEKEMAGGEEGMDNSNRASHIGDDATEKEIEADAERKEQERLAAVLAAEKKEAARQAELEEATQKKAAGEAEQEEDEQPVSEPASEVDDEKPEETNRKPGPEPPVVETKEKPAPEPPVMEPKKVKDDTTASSAAAATKVGTEIQAEATGGCCVIS